MNWLHLLLDIVICVPICATICYLLDKRRQDKFLHEVYTIIKNERMNR